MALSPLRLGRLKQHWKGSYLNLNFDGKYDNIEGAPNVLFHAVETSEEIEGG